MSPGLTPLLEGTETLAPLAEGMETLSPLAEVVETLIALAEETGVAALPALYPSTVLTYPSAAGTYPSVGTARTGRWLDANTEGTETLLPLLED